VCISITANSTGGKPGPLTDDICDGLANYVNGQWVNPANASLVSEFTCTNSTPMKVTVCAELVGNVDVVDLSGFAEDTYAIAQLLESLQLSCSFPGLNGWVAPAHRAEPRTAAMRMPTFNTPASSQPCVPASPRRTTLVYAVDYGRCRLGFSYTQECDTPFPGFPFCACIRRPNATPFAMLPSISSTTVAARMTRYCFTSDIVTPFDPSSKCGQSKQAYKVIKCA
jgi:hypothetical protein